MKNPFAFNMNQLWKCDEESNECIHINIIQRIQYNPTESLRIQHLSAFNVFKGYSTILLDP